LIVASEKFRPNPTRAIYVDGPINEQLVSRLTPQILQLQSDSRDPITVYILSSPGGHVVSMEAVLRLLKSSDQDLSLACDLITVVTNKAASAAADLLASGDYAIAFPESMILYHGIRTPFRESMTAETTSLLAHYLRLSNDAYAIELARKVEMRFLFRFLVLRTEFKDCRQKNAAKNLSDLDCFLNLVMEKLSKKARAVFEKAKHRYGRYEALLTNVMQKGKTSKGPRRMAQMEADRIKAILDFEVKTNKDDPSWTFKDGGMARLGDDFFCNRCWDNRDAHAGIDERDEGRHLSCRLDHLRDDSSVAQNSSQKIMETGSVLSCVHDKWIPFEFAQTNLFLCGKRVP